MPANEATRPVKPARRTCGDGLVMDMVRDVGGQRVGSGVPTRAVFLEAAHDDPIQIAAQ